MNHTPAFPVSALVYNGDGKDPTTIINDGMTLRDYFAAKAMTGLLTAEIVGEYSNVHVAEIAYRIADAMMKAREE
jgi:hypothetical protein